MGLIDGLIGKVLGRLMFWRRPTVAGEFDVNGCFTLPGSDEPAEPARDPTA